MTSDGSFGQPAYFAQMVMALGGVPSIARISEIVAGQTRYPQWV